MFPTEISFMNKQTNFVRFEFIEYTVSAVYWRKSQRQKGCISIQILLKFPIGAINIKIPLI